MYSAGMTETSPVSTHTRIDSPLDKRAGTVGLIGPHLEIKIVNSFPMTVTGKIQKLLMRQQSIEELGLQSAASIETA